MSGNYKLRKASTSKTENFKCEYQSQNICNKVQIFFQNQKFCDVVLIAGVDGVRVETHRMILAASSDYFFTMFSSCLCESTAKEIVLDQVDGATLKMLINFMYSTLIEIRNDNVESLLTAANLFQMQSVVEQCCSFMIRQLEPSNCLGVALYAEQHNQKVLYENANAMVCDRFTDLHEEDEFYMLEVDQLSTFLSSDDLCVSCEEDVFRSLIKWVHHDKENREKFLSKLLSCIRFSLLQTDFVTNEVATACKSNECHELIEKTLRLHATPRNTKHKIFYISVWFTSDDILSAEVYSPILRKWIYQEWPGKPNNRSVFSGTVLGDTLVIAGGRLENFIPTNIVESLNLKTLDWTELPPMKTPRRLFGMAELNGKLYVLGGRNDSGVLRLVERYDPVNKAWEHVASMWDRRYEHSVVACNGLLYVIGGSNTFECYNPQTNTWTRNEPMKSATSSAGIAVVNNALYAVSAGGSMVQRYNIEDDTWEEISPLREKTETIQCCAIGDSLIINCGNNVVKEFNTITRQWKTLATFEKLCGKGILLTM